jgi:glycerol-3-phosphate dehydrogenase
MYDAIVIGGGITGAGVLRDLALRGLRALLVEKGRLGAATTASSSHLIHGGLRYLLYDRLTTHASCWDAGHIVRVARPLLTRLPILWPVYRNHQRGLETVETLLESYDRFQPLKEGRRHLRLSAGETRRLVPGLAAEGLRGGLLFDEYWVDPVALVKANIESARRAGAECREETEAVGVALAGGRVSGVHVRGPRGRETLAARVVVNAAGPWADRVAGLAGARSPLRLQKGSHLVYDGTPDALGSPARPLGLLLEALDRDRYVFILPGGGKTLVGPTDLPAEGGPDNPSASPEEIAYLLGSARRYFPDFPERAETVAGARPILDQEGPEKLLSRGFRVTDHGRAGGPEGLVTVAGGKMSDFRLMAEAAGDAAAERLGGGPGSSTGRISLAGEPVADLRDPGPSLALRAVLDRHPRIRELHALAYLGAAFAGHLARRVFGSAGESTREEALEHYKNGASGFGVGPPRGNGGPGGGVSPSDIGRL